MSSEIFELAKEIAECRDSELALKLLKLKDILKSSDDPIKLKHDIYKYDILEALSISFKNEYGYIKDGWNVAVELVKIFCICTKNFGSVDKNYQDNFLPTAAENMLVLAKKFQDKYIRAKGFSDEHLNQFKTVITEYTKLNENNSFIVLKSLNSQRLFQILLTDEQNSSAIVMNTLRALFMIKRSFISKLPEKTTHIILDEVIYKLATSDLREAGLAIFQLLVTMFQLEPSLLRLVVKRYKGLKTLTVRWKNKNLDKELTDFNNAWDGAYKSRITNQELDEKAIMIQKTFRGYMDRKRLKKANKGMAKFQKSYRAKKELENKKKHQQAAKDELQFQLLLQHRRKQRQRKMEMLELLEILPAYQIEEYLEKQREYSARIIQANFRGYLARKKFAKKRQEIVRERAAVKIQRATRRWQANDKKIRETPAFYSRPSGLDANKREFLFDRIRKNQESLPPHPRSFEELNELHDKGQRIFQNYVINQRNIRTQQQKMQVLLAMANNDADLMLNCPKLSQVTEDDINSYYSHKSTPVMLAAKEAHKNMLKKHRANWWQLLDDSDSECDDSYDKDFDDLNANIRNLNFNAITENYYKEGEVKKIQRELNIGHSSSDTYQLHNSVSKRQRNQLKTNNLRKTMARMMNNNPDKSRIWSVGPRESNHINQ